MNVIELKSTEKNELINITSKIAELVNLYKPNASTLLIYVPHTTAGITINECYDSAVSYDILSAMNTIAPSSKNYRHIEGNSDGHIKTVLFGNQVLIPICDGKLMLGKWQGIFFCESDGPRKRKVYVQFLKVEAKTKNHRSFKECLIKS